MALENYFRDATPEERKSVDDYIKSISKPLNIPKDLVGCTTEYTRHVLNLDKVQSVNDCKKILKYLCDLAIKPLPKGIEYANFSEVKEYFD